jgi:hypothetical protein
VELWILPAGAELPPDEAGRPPEAQRHQRAPEASALRASADPMDSRLSQALPVTTASSERPVGAVRRRPLRVTAPSAAQHLPSGIAPDSSSSVRERLAADSRARLSRRATRARAGRVRRIRTVAVTSPERLHLARRLR